MSLLIVIYVKLIRAQIKGESSWKAFEIVQAGESGGLDQHGSDADTKKQTTQGNI